MTSTNVSNLGSVKLTGAAEGQNAKKTRREEEMASIFSSLMNQMSAKTDAAAGKNNPEPQKTSATADAYDSYRYRENGIEQAKAAPESNPLEETPEEAVQFEESTVELVSEKLGIPEADVREAMAELGYRALDLLNPQKLANLVMQLSNVSDQAQLLLDPNFQELMLGIGELGAELAEKLGVEKEALTMLAETVPEELPQPENGVVLEDAKLSQPDQAEAQTVAAVQQTAEIPEEYAKTEQPAVSAAEEAEETKPTVEITVEQEASSKEAPIEEAKEASKEFGGHPQGETQTGEQMAAPLHPETLQQPEAPQPPAGTFSYSSVDAMDIIRQIAESVKVAVSAEVSSVEMQLNPENLGKIYLHISEKEGMVSAQLAAQNEAVKEALEVQAATLRENLNQAGVKVDAIEVTVATHEFERNLEQEQRQKEEQESDRKENSRGRRNLNIDSLDELSGVMTEEEALVAQIMRDNGNSVDLTA